MLNDEIINFYLYLLTAEDLTNLLLPTQFMTKLMENNIYCYDRATRWTNRYYTLQDYKSIYIPINYNTHWTLLIIDVSNQSVKYLDSALNQQKANYYIGNRAFIEVYTSTKCQIVDRHNLLSSLNK